jgi:signal transduction histidine kinase
MKRVGRRVRSLTCVAVLLVGCAPAGERAWRNADELWQRRDPGAFAAWQALDPAQPDGGRARRALALADDEYRHGIALLADGDAAAARTLLEQAARRAPIDPMLYLPFARACHARGLEARAATMYRKFLAQAPAGADADAARKELTALGDDIGASFDPPPAGSAWPWWPFGVAGAALVALGALLLGRRRLQRTSLATLAAENPELEPAIAFLVGCLRHELLKHRIVAIGDAVRAMVDGRLAEAERQFLLRRLYGGEPLAVAWAGHLGAFMRALGPRFDLVRRDPQFKLASRAITAIARAEAGLARGDRETAGRVIAAHAQLVALDSALGQLTARLQQVVVDDAFLRAHVVDVRREAARVAVDVVLAAPPADLAVECYRFDLELVLRNVVRNAVAAAARGPSPSRVALTVELAVEPTGDEIVRILVRDTNPAPLPAPSPLGEGRGLALVHAALQRCDGSLSIEPAGDGFAKCVVVRLFAALRPAAEAAA